jgi:hypothetical protein
LVICGAFGAALFVNRHRLTESHIATAFFVVAALLLVWRLSDRQSVPTIGDLRDIAISIGGVFALLLAVTLFVGKFRSSPYQAMPPESSAYSASAPPAAAPSSAPAAAVSGDNDKPPSPLPEGQVVTTIELLQLYQNYDHAMEQNYGGRFLTVTGQIANVNPGVNEVPYVQLTVPSNAARVESMQALFQSNPGAVKGLKPGDQVMLSCSPVYDADVENVALNDCSVVR